jgi:hypothetical protein
MDTELLQNVGMIVGIAGAGLFTLLLVLSLVVKRNSVRRVLRFMMLGVLGVTAGAVASWFYGVQAPAPPPDTRMIQSRVLAEELSLTNVWAVGKLYGEGLDSATITRIGEALDLAAADSAAQAIPILESFEDAIDAPALVADLGVMYALIGDVDRALARLQTAVGLSPDLAHVVANQQTVRSWREAQLAARTLEVEPNNDLLRPNDVPLGLPVTAILSSAGDTDGFAFRTPYGARDRYTVRVTNRFTELRPHLVLYYPDRRQLVSTSPDERRVTPGQDASLELILTTGARFFATVASLGGAGPYALTIEPQHAYDRFEPNEDWLAASPMGGETSWEASLLDSEDVDYFQFTVPDAGRARVVLENRSRTLRPQLAVYNAQNREIARTTSYAPQVNPGRNVSLPFTAADSLSYHVAVRSVGGSGAYTLRIEGG